MEVQSEKPETQRKEKSAFRQKGTPLKLDTFDGKSLQMLSSFVRLGGFPCGIAVN